MFGFRRQRATTAAIDVLRPIIGTISHTRGLPASFWFDSYVLGFIHFMIAFHAKVATNGRITGADLGFCFADTYTALSNMNGNAITRQATDLIESNNELFLRGGDDAAAICCYQTKILKNETAHPLVQKATEMAGGDSDRAKVLAMMVIGSLYQEIKERVDPKT